MKKLLLTLFTICLATITFAQTFNIGIKGGVNFSSISQSETTYNPEVRNITGFHAGIVADLGFRNFSIQPGLYYITKGETRTDMVLQNDQLIGTAATKEKLNYLELPVNLLYKIRVAPRIKVYLGGGPYLGYGLSGTVVSTPNSLPYPSYHGNLSFGGASTKTYNNPDYGVASKRVNSNFFMNKV